MAHPKGVPNPNAGRKPGVPNKVTAQARQAIADFIDLNAEKIQGWVDEVYQQDGAKEALASYLALLEFAVPKLARTEHTGKDGDDLPTPVIIGSALDTLPDSVRAKLREALKDVAPEKG